MKVIYQINISTLYVLKINEISNCGLIIWQHLAKSNHKCSKIKKM